MLRLREIVQYLKKGRVWSRWDQNGNFQFNTVGVFRGFRRTGMTYDTGIIGREINNCNICKISSEITQVLYSPWCPRAFISISSFFILIVLERTNKPPPASALTTSTPRSATPDRMKSPKIRDRRQEEEAGIRERPKTSQSKFGKSTLSRRQHRRPNLCSHIGRNLPRTRIAVTAIFAQMCFLRRTTDGPNIVKRHCVAAQPPHVD